jgi:hypothetical protein
LRASGGRPQARSCPASVLRDAVLRTAPPDEVRDPHLRGRTNVTLPRYALTMYRVNVMVLMTHCGRAQRSLPLHYEHRVRIPSGDLPPKAASNVTYSLLFVSLLFVWIRRPSARVRRSAMRERSARVRPLPPPCGFVREPASPRIRSAVFRRTYATGAFPRLFPISRAQPRSRRPPARRSRLARFR